MSVAPSFTASAFPFFHLVPFPYSALPAQLDSLKTEEIAVSWILLELDNASWRKLLRLWRARREKARGASDQDPVAPVFELLDMNFHLGEDTELGFLESAQLAALPLHPGYSPSMAERARAVFLSRRNQTASQQAATDETTTSQESISSSHAPLRVARAMSPVSDSSLIVPKSSRQPTPPTDSASGSGLPSPIPSSAHLEDSEVSAAQEPSRPLLALSKWMALERPVGKPSRALASDAFDWLPEPLQPVPTPIFYSSGRRSISPFEESPSPTPEPEAHDQVLTDLQTQSFFDSLKFGSMERDSSTRNSTPLGGRDVDVKPDLSLMERIDLAPSQSLSAGGRGDSLLQRISGARLPSPDPSGPRSPPIEIPTGVVPRSVTRTWHSFLLHSILDKLSDDEIKSFVENPGLPTPAAIRIKRYAEKKRFCLVFVAYRTPEERDLAALRLEGLSYGQPKLTVTIKAVDKPPETYEWAWETTTEQFRKAYFERVEREPAAKRQRISSVGSRQRSPSPPRSAPSAVSSIRGSLPSPRRHLTPAPTLPDFTSRPRSPLRPLFPSRARSRSPDSRHAMSSLDRPVPKHLVDKLFTMIVHNLADGVKRQDVIDFFPGKSFVGVAVNHPDNRRYSTVAAQRTFAQGSAFFAFETSADRDWFAKRFCKKRFKHSAVPMWYDIETERYEDWIWSEMSEVWTQRNGGPSSSSTLPPLARARSPSSSSGRPRSPLPESDSDYHPRSREPSVARSSSTAHVPSPSGPRLHAPDARRYSRVPSPGPYSRSDRFEPDLPPASSRSTDLRSPPRPPASAYDSRPISNDPYAPQSSRNGDSPPVQPSRKRATWSEEPADTVPPPPLPRPAATQYPPATYQYAPPTTQYPSASYHYPQPNYYPRAALPYPTRSVASFHRPPPPPAPAPPASSGAYYHPNAPPYPAARYGYAARGTEMR